MKGNFIMITVKIGFMWSQVGNVWETDFQMRDGRDGMEHVKNIPSVKKWLADRGENIDDWKALIRFEDEDPIKGDMLTFSASSCQIKMIEEPEVHEKFIVLVPGHYMIDQDERKKLEKKLEEKKAYFVSQNMDYLPWCLRMH